MPRNSKNNSRKKPQQQVTNWRLMLISVVFVAIMAPLVYLWHAYAVSKMGEYFSDRADFAMELAKEKEDLEQQLLISIQSPDDLELASAYEQQLQDFDHQLGTFDSKLANKDDRPTSTDLWGKATTYLNLLQNSEEPDGDISRRLAIAFSKSASGLKNPRRCGQLYSRASALLPDEKNELLIQSAEFFNQAFDFGSAEQSLQQVSLEKPLSDESTALMAKVKSTALWGKMLSDQTNGSNPELGSSLENAIRLNPTNLELPLYLALLYGKPERRGNLSPAQIAAVDDQGGNYLDKANETVDAMVNRNPTSGLALLQRYKFRTTMDSFKSIKDLLAAEKLAPMNSEIQFQLGQARYQEYTKNNPPLQATSPPEVTEPPSELLKAKENFEHCAIRTPQRLATFLYLGNIEGQLGNTAGAIDIWLKTLATPRNFVPDLKAMVQIRQNVILALIDEYDSEDPATANRMAQAKEQLRLLGEFITESANSSIAPETLFELSQTRQYLQAIFLSENKEYGAAIDLLVPSIRNESNAPTARTFMMVRLLGRIYLELGLNDQAVKTYENAAKFADNNATRDEFLERAFMKRAQSGRLATEKANVSPPDLDTSNIEELYAYARFLLQVETNKAPNDRDMAAFKKIMARVAVLNSTNKVDEIWQYQVTNLLGEILVLDASNQGLPELVEQIKSLEPMAKDNELLSRSLADLYGRLSTRDTSLKLLEDSNRMLEQYLSLAGFSSDSYVIAANVLVKQQNPEAAKAKIQEGIDALGSKDQKELRLAMVSLLLTQGQVSEAYESLLQLATDFPDAPDLITRLASFCVQFPTLNQDEPAKWETQLKNIEGADGVYSKCLQVIRTLRKVDTDTKSPNFEVEQEQLNEAKAKCRSIVSQRPDWPIAHTLTGQVLLAQSVNLQKINLSNRVIDDSSINQLRMSAMNALNRAVELGETRRWILVPLAQMQPPEDRKATLERLKTATIVADPDLLRMQVSMSIAGNDTETALRTVEYATKTDPENGMHWLTLAGIQLNLGESDKALKSCQEARSAARSQPIEVKQRTMRSLINFYGTASQFGPQPSTTTWEELAAALQPTVVALYKGSEQTFQSAQTLALLNNPRAGAEFSKAVDLEPQNQNYLRTALAYFTSGKVSGDVAFSEGIRICELLRKLPGLDDRQRLSHVWTEANLYAKRGTKDDWVALQELFSENNIDPAARNAGEYNILLAVLLLTKDAVANSERQQNLNQAFGLVENGSSTAELVVGGQIQQLLSAFEEDPQTQAELIADARTRFIKAGESSNLATPQVITIVNFFIDQQDLETASLYLARLKSMVGKPLVESIPAIRLQARIMKQQGVASNEIISVVDGFASEMTSQIRNTSKMNQAKICQQVAKIYEAIDLSAESLKWSEKAVAIEPRYRLTLAMENNRLGDKDKAVDLCLAGFSDTGDTTYIIALTQILITGKPTKDHFQKANPIFAEALQSKTLNKGQRINLLVSIANARIAGEGRTPDAIELYKEAAELAPGNLLILNNIATAYSETESELNVAMDYINQALLRHGNRPELLDTKAVILMKQGKLQKALDYLTDITNLESDPRYWWHRAEVEFKMYEQTDNADLLQAAREHFEMAQSLQLSNQVFTPNEESRLEKLEKALLTTDSPSVHKPLPLSLSIIAVGHSHRLGMQQP